MYARVAFPDTKNQDLKSLCAQTGISTGSVPITAHTAQELFEKLPTLQPLGADSKLLPLDGHPHSFRPNGFSWESAVIQNADVYFTAVLSKREKKAQNVDFAKLEENIWAAQASANEPFDGVDYSRPGE